MTFRFALEDDCPLILDFIRALADYEKMSDQVVATEALLREWIFEKKKDAGIALCYSATVHLFLSGVNRRCQVSTEVSI